MSAFLTPLDMRLMCDPHGIPLKNRDGRQLFRLLSDFVYQSDVAQCVITVPAGYVTDLASIPQVLLSLFGEIAQEPAVPHDFVYSTGLLPRSLGDSMLYEACILTNEPAWKAKLIYAGVRVGGASHFNHATKSVIGNPVTP